MALWREPHDRQSYDGEGCSTYHGFLRDEWLLSQNWFVQARESEGDVPSAEHLNCSAEKLLGAGLGD